MADDATARGGEPAAQANSGAADARRRGHLDGAPATREASEADRLRAALIGQLADCEALHTLHVFDELPSTNAWLLEREPPPPGRCDAALALHQTAGRGRRGKAWTAPAGSGLCLSVGWCYAEMPPAASALTLALGVAAARALESLGVDRVDLKWPNDLVWRDRKLGGVLVETTSAGGRFVVVAGIGVNVRLPQGFDLGDGGPAWSRGVADVAAAGAGACIADVAAAMIPAFAAALAAFAEAGFAPLAAAYNRRNWLGGRDALIDGERVRCAGVAADGRLVTSRGPVSSGEVIPVDIIEARA